MTKSIYIPYIYVYVYVDVYIVYFYFNREEIIIYSHGLLGSVIGSSNCLNSISNFLILGYLCCINFIIFFINPT